MSLILTGGITCILDKAIFNKSLAIEQYLISSHNEFDPHWVPTLVLGKAILNKRLAIEQCLVSTPNELDPYWVPHNCARLC